MNIRKLMIELMPRLIASVAIVVLSIVAAAALTHQNEGEWIEKLDEVAAKSSTSFDAYIRDLHGLAVQLGDDPRILEDFTKKRITQSTRAALYEFSTINKIKDAYIFDIQKSNVAAKSVGAANLPQDTMDILATAYDTGWTRFVHLTYNSRGKFKIMASSAIRNEYGEIVGYSIYAIPLLSAFKRLTLPADIDSNIELTLLRVNDFHPHALVWGYNRNPRVRLLHKGDESYPTSKYDWNANSYTSPNNEKYLLAISDIPTRPYWLVGAAIKNTAISGQTTSAQRIIQMLAVGLIIIILLFPRKNGAYSNLLKKKYNDIAPESSPVAQKILKKMGATSEDISKISSQEKASKNKGVASTSSAVKASTGKNNEPDSNHGAGKSSPKADVKLNVGVVAAGKVELDKVETQRIQVAPGKVRDEKVSKAVKDFSIRDGIKEERFQLRYQPIVSTQTNEPVMYEVLMRIQDRDGEIIPPPDWLPIAREENLFDAIDSGVVNLALRTHILEDNPINVPLTFNISGNTFDSLGFMEDLMGKLADRPDLASLMVFELSSKEIIEDERARRFIRECREMGFQFSIDYFGGGVATLEAAKKMRFNYIKIDALKYDIKNKEHQKELVLLSKKSKALNLPIIVERIETEETLKFLKQLNIPYVQGYHIGEPSEELV